MHSLLVKRLLLFLDWACRIAVAVVFLLAAVPKILEPVAFAKAITNYRVVLPVIGQDYVYAAAVFMPPLEAIAALALFWNRSKRAGSLICGALLMLFIVLIGQAMLRGLNIDCGCFGTGQAALLKAHRVGMDKILQNATLLAACAFVFARGDRK